MEPLNISLSSARHSCSEVMKTETELQKGTPEHPQGPPASVWSPWLVAGACEHFNTELKSKYV